MLIALGASKVSIGLALFHDILRLKHFGMRVKARSELGCTRAKCLNVSSVSWLRIFLLPQETNANKEISVSLALRTGRPFNLLAPLVSWSTSAHF